MRRIAEIAAPVAVATAVLGGCGGSSKPTTHTTSAAATTPQVSAPQVHGKLDRAHYIAAADGVCTKARNIATAGNKAVGQALEAGQSAAAAQAIQRLYPNYVGAIVQLETIRQPRADRVQLRTIFKVMEEQTRTLPIYARALASGDQTTMKAVSVVERRLTAQVGKTSKAYGFKVCGRS